MLYCALGEDSGCQGLIELEVLMSSHLRAQMDMGILEGEGWSLEVYFERVSVVAQHAG